MSKLSVFLNNHSSIVSIGETLTAIFIAGYIKIIWDYFANIYWRYSQDEKDILANTPYRPEESHTIIGECVDIVGKIIPANSNGLIEGRKNLYYLDLLCQKGCFTRVKNSFILTDKGRKMRKLFQKKRSNSNHNIV